MIRTSSPPSSIQPNLSWWPFHSKSSWAGLCHLPNRKVRFESLYETLYFLPYIVPMVPAAIIWKWIYAPGTYGLANYLLDKMGLPGVGWMSTPQISLLAVIGIHVWKQLGFFVIIFLVGLKNIPASYEGGCAGGWGDPPGR